MAIVWSTPTHGFDPFTRAYGLDCLADGDYIVLGFVWLACRGRPPTILGTDDSTMPPQESRGPAPASSAAPLRASPSGEARIWRRIVGIFGLVGAVLVDMLLFGMLAFLSDSPSNDRLASFVAPMAFLQLPILVVGFALTLAGSARTLRLAAICAVLFFVLALGIGISFALLSDSPLDSCLGVGLLFVSPDVILILGIVAMRPRRSQAIATDRWS